MSRIVEQSRRSLYRYYLVLYVPGILVVGTCYQVPGNVLTGTLFLAILYSSIYDEYLVPISLKSSLNIRPNLGRIKVSRSAVRVPGLFLYPTGTSQFLQLAVILLKLKL